MRAYCSDQTSIECKHMIVRYSQYPYKCYQFRILLDEHLSLRYRDDKPRFNVNYRKLKHCGLQLAPKAPLQ